MSFKNLRQLNTFLTRMHLVTAAQIETCLSELKPQQQDATHLLQLLESRSLLTSYQTGQLQNGDAEGLVLDGNKLLYRNASGSFARVFRAEAIDTGKMVGLKLLRQRWAKDPASVQQFHREAKVCQRLKHKNIVPIYDIGQQGDYHFFTMEFIEGGNLRDFMTIRQKLSPTEAVKCALEMAEGLEYALKMGLTHRDLKLTNVLMGTDGVAKLVDFGLAGDENLSGARGGDGVPRALEYATLERGTNVPINDPRSDLFFLGTILYELLTGTPPYPRTRSREERRKLSRYSQIRPIREIDPTIDPAIGTVVEQLITLNPHDRYQTATAVIQDLRRVAYSLRSASSAQSPKKSQRQSTANNASPDHSDGNNKPPQGEQLPTVMCIENRPKHQDILRNYLSKHGFRVLMFSDLQRGVQRIKTAPPNCTILMGEAIDDDAVFQSAYEQLLQATATQPVIGIAVLAKRQQYLKEKCRQTTTARLLLQPINLRELRREIHVAFQKLSKETPKNNAS